MIAAAALMASTLIITVSAGRAFGFLAGAAVGGAWVVVFVSIDLWRKRAADVAAERRREQMEAIK